LVDRALCNVRSSLIVGPVLIVVVLFLFLFNLRTAAISSTAIPLSLRIVANIFGSDLDGLDREAQQVARSRSGRD